MAAVDIYHFDEKIYRDMVSLVQDTDRVNFVYETFNKHFSRVCSTSLGGDVDKILNEAYEVTNSIETPWFHNSSLFIPSELREGCRSTSIGDVIIIEDVKYMVASFGFIKLDNSSFIF